MSASCTVATAIRKRKGAGRMLNGVPTVAFGKTRDSKIVELIAEHGPFYRDQVQLLIFPTHKWPQKCSQRLNKLTKTGTIKRVRFDKDGQYVYFCGKWTDKSEHKLMCNWVYTTMVAQKKSWYKIQTFQRENNRKWKDGELQADAFVVLVNTAAGTLKPLFIECDRATNPFNKIPKYLSYKSSNEWVNEWWSKKDAEGYYNFPKILVVSDKPERVKRAIEKDDPLWHDKDKRLKVNVVTLDQIKQDVYVCL